MSELAPQEVATVPVEARALAYELARAYRRMADYDKKQLALVSPETLRRINEFPPAEYLQFIKSRPVDQLTWEELQFLTEHEPESAAAAWQHVKLVARDELDSGFLAAQAAEGSASTPFDRARFLAVLEDFRQDWQPRNGVERRLVETLAVAYSAMLSWQYTLTSRSTNTAGREKQNHGGWLPPRVSEKEATEQAVAMVDRFNRMFLRTLRALRDLRRYAPSVVVHNATQINVGGPQINVAGQAELVSKDASPKPALPGEVAPSSH